MKKIILFTLLSIGCFTMNAQDDSYTNFTDAQMKNAVLVSEKKLNQEVKFESGMDYDGKLFWYLFSKDGKEYYFNSSTTFVDVKHEEAVYSSLMEYVIETIGF